MFIGHYALALAAKRAAPRTSLGTLFAATSLADLLWPVFLLLGWEQAHVVPGPNPFLTLWVDSSFSDGCSWDGFPVTPHSSWSSTSSTRSSSSTVL